MSRRPSRSAVVVALVIIVGGSLLGWRRLDGASPGVVALGLATGLAVVVAVVGTLLVGQHRAQEATTAGGWAGLAALHLVDLEASPALAGQAPRRGWAAAVLLNRGTVGGRLHLADDVRFEPGRVGLALGAGPVTITGDQVRSTALKGRHLSLVLSDGSVLRFDVVHPAFLHIAARRLAR